MKTQWIAAAAAVIVLLAATGCSGTGGVGGQGITITNPSCVCFQSFLVASSGIAVGNATSP